MDLQRAQRDAVVRMLRLNRDPKEGGLASSAPSSSSASASASDPSSDEATWKVLVYDAHCQRILAPLVNTADLRRLGVTLHLLVGQARQRVPDVPAVYFLEPTEENAAAVAKDLQAGLYDAAHINFASCAPPALLRSLARRSAGAAASRVESVFDQYVDFVALEPTLLTLAHSDSYVRLNDPPSEEALMAYVDGVVESLFSAVATMGAVPVIRARRGEAAELVAQKLDQRIRDHLQGSRNNLFSEARGAGAAASASSAAAGAASSYHRPLLVLVDRNADLTVPLHHPWTYQALVHDLFGLRSNQVRVGDATHDLDGKADHFWAEHAGHGFPKVAEACEEFVKEYKEAMGRVRGGGDDDPGRLAGLDDGAAGDTDHLRRATSQLPELMKRKRLLDTHTNLAHAVLHEIKTRELDVFFSLEEDCLNRSAVDRKALAAQLSSGTKGRAADRVRLLLMYYLTRESVPRDELESLEAAVTAAAEEAAAAGEELPWPGGPLAPLQYLKKYRQVHRMATSEPAAREPAAPAAASAGFGMLRGLAEKVYSGVGMVKNLLPGDEDLPLTKVVESLMDNREDGGPADEYAYFDPKLGKRGGGARDKKSTAFNESLVFVLGGGSYVEVENLRAWARKASTPQAKKTVAYASTEMLRPHEFARQLALLSMDRSARG